MVGELLVWIRAQSPGIVWRAACVSLLVAVLACTSGRDERTEVLVFAAISLSNALEEIGRSFEKQGNVDVAFSYGGSQMLAQQIAKGAPADVFISAGESPVEFLSEKELVEPDVVRIISNRLVVVTRSGDVTLEALGELTTGAGQRVAIADPDLAPAGRYAQESLTHLGLWEELQASLVFGADSRATLTYVETGNADIAILYETDARTARGVLILDVVPPESYSPIVYPAVVVSRSQEKTAAAEFVRFLGSESSAAAFRKHGFAPVGH